MKAKEKAFIARDENGELYMYYTGEKPHKGFRVWFVDGYSGFSKINNDFFPEVKWEDKEPTEIGIQIVTKSLDSSQLPQH